MWHPLGGSSRILSNPRGGGDGPDRGIRPGGGGDRGATGLNKDTGDAGCGDNAKGGDWRCDGLRGPAGEDGGWSCSLLKLSAVPSMLLPLWCSGEPARRYIDRAILKT